MSAGQTQRVKNRAPAAIQITAEQLLREAHDRSEGQGHKTHRTQITDPDELREYRMGKRKGFEDAIRMNRVHLGNYVKYAKWEEAQAEHERSRSIWERALDIDHRSASVWLQYAEFEMRNKFVNHARNVWDRCVTIMPRVDQFWYKYTYMEEMVESWSACRTVFERWMAWEPDDNAWLAYVKFEERRKDARRARAVLERFVLCHPRLSSYLKYARWEERQQQVPLARQVYERALAELGEWEMEEHDEAKLYANFARFEEQQKEFERARAIYAYATNKVSRDDGPELHKQFLAFEKKHGSVTGIEAQVAAKRRGEYERRVAESPRDFDAWFDLVRLEEGAGNADLVRDAYERAISNIPPADKKYWRRYVYLWINYAVYEELEAQDLDRARAVYRAALDVVPHHAFTFAKLWLLAAQFEVRCRDVGAARRLLGEALGKCKKLGKPKLYVGYVEVERQLGEVDRCRQIYAKFVDAAPTNCRAWAGFGSLEATVGEAARARAVYELAVAQPQLDMPEALWKAFIDFEVHLEAEPDEDDEVPDESAPSRAATLFERLLERTQHVKVWVAYARYHAEREPPRFEDARAAYRRGNDHLKQLDGGKDERVVLLEAWAAFEASTPGKDALAEVRALMPRKVKKRRERPEDGSFEEYYDYIFPDERKAPINLKILEMARQWKSNEKKRALDEDES
ncbi:hypothetical protein M885DRAFT_581520 [Pelagophyceae sp. CCMP2097]|nr:hypothetical protein M885DRAFT_581520 [Pelagophyceae sp. CCMP2097]|mmetsp:Transcript_1246/g.3870  ORF Transcript_1246/g.3870 Transcript_1246/m.3870 type:complete len:685 (-) Transcript_1246:363-2417(-)